MKHLDCRGGAHHHWLFSTFEEQGLLFVVVHGLLLALASCCRAQALRLKTQ